MLHFLLIPPPTIPLLLYLRFHLSAFAFSVSVSLSFSSSFIFLLHPFFCSCFHEMILSGFFYRTPLGHFKKYCFSSLFWLLQTGTHSWPFFFSSKTTIHSANHCLSFCWLQRERIREARWGCGRGDGKIMTDVMIINIFCVWIVKVSSKSLSQAQEVKLLVCGFKCSASGMLRLVRGSDAVWVEFCGFLLLLLWSKPCITKKETLNQPTLSVN